MPENTVQPRTASTNRIILWFLLCWTFFNGIQASTLEAHGDEAYYWLYSRYLDWGYFDHPPMVALFIRIGYALFHNTFGLRLLTVLANSASLYIIWLILKKYGADAKAFVFIASGIFIFHIYSIITTPDVPLLFFTTLFYYFYRQYVDEDKWSLAILLSIIIACLLYSKYNGILVVGFTVLSNIKLLKRGTFWGIALIAILLFIPHIIWQVSHGFPSVTYHLFDRTARTYNLINTLYYVPSQLLMAGPLIGWLLFYRAFTIKIKDAFIRCLLVNCVGTFIFFFISSSKGEVQPQWTYVLYAPLVMLALISFKQQNGYPKWLPALAAINFVLIFALRLVLLFGGNIARLNGHLNSLYGFKDWAAIVKQKVGNSYLVMNDGFQNPSKYDLFTNSLKGFSYDSRYYRLTQFDIWPMEDSLQHKRVYYLSNYPIANLTTDTIKVSAGTWYGAWVNDTRTYQKIQVDTRHTEIVATAGQKIRIDLQITNPYNHSVSFGIAGWQHPVVLEACLFNGNQTISEQKADSSFNTINLCPGASAPYTFTINAPLEKGNYDLLFSLRTEPFQGSRNSKIISLTVR